MPRSTNPIKPKKNPWPQHHEKKVRDCRFCREKIEKIDYNLIDLIPHFTTGRGKVRSAEQTGTCRHHQAQVANAIKVARELGLLAYVNNRPISPGDFKRQSR